MIFKIEKFKQYFYSPPTTTVSNFHLKAHQYRTAHNNYNNYSYFLHTTALLEVRMLSSFLSRDAVNSSKALDYRLPHLEGIPLISILSLKRGREKKKNINNKKLILSYLSNHHLCP